MRTIQCIKLSNVDVIAELALSIGNLTCSLVHIGVFPK